VAQYLLDKASVDFRGLPAVDGVSLEIEPGERVGLVGPSGAGKTTLLRLLVGAVRPSRGRVVVDGRDLAGLSARDLRGVRSRTGFVHQDHRLVPNHRVVTNVLAGRLGRWSFLRSLREVFWPRRAAVKQVHRLLARTGIPDKLYQRVDTLSGGQQQRVAIARALYQEPQALLADEPVSSVDPARAEDTVRLLARSRSRRTSRSACRCTTSISRGATSRASSACGRGGSPSTASRPSSPTATSTSCTGSRRRR